MVLVSASFVTLCVCVRVCACVSDVFFPPFLDAIL